MIENRELNIDDYLSILRRRAKVILIPALLAPLELLGLLALFTLFNVAFIASSLTVRNPVLVV